MAREEDNARSVPPITLGSLSYEAGTAPGARAGPANSIATPPTASQD
jgi:hypothetical protein